jgi:membrane carboxypeptidase/penicillin-binding protein PbpC
MERLKNASLILCLFIVLAVIFSGYFRAGAVGTLFGALAGTPLLVHVFNRLAPSRRAEERPVGRTAELVPNGEPASHPAEQVFVLRMERPNGRVGD